MTSAARRAAAFAGLAFAALLAGALLLVPAARAATPTPTPTPTAKAAAPTFTYTQADDTLFSGHAASFSPAAGTVKVLAGATVTLYNKGAAALTLTGTLIGANKSATLAAGKTGSLVVPTASKYPAVFTLTGTEPAVSGLANNSTSASTNVTATGPPPSPPAPTGSASSGRTPPSGGGSASAPASGSAGSSSSVSVPEPGLPGGVIPSAAPSIVTSDGLPPVVAPYLTPTPSASTSSPGPAATSSPPATATLTSSGPSDGNRALGLPAAVSGVVLVGIAAGVGKVLLAHPAARAVARRR